MEPNEDEGGISRPLELEEALTIVASGELSVSMGNIKAIRSEADYNAALARIEALMDAEPNTPEGDELDVLGDLVEHYEEKHVPMGVPSAVAAIEFRLEQADLASRDLIPFLGSRAKVSEVLSGKRPLTMSMARALHEHLGIPAAVLLQQPASISTPTLTRSSGIASRSKPWPRRAGSRLFET